MAALACNDEYIGTGIDKQRHSNLIGTTTYRSNTLCLEVRVENSVFVRIFVADVNAYRACENQARNVRVDLLKAAC